MMFACLHPAHRVSTDVYHPRGHYVEPMEPRGKVSPALLSKATYGEADWNRGRWFEIEATGFRAQNEAMVFSHDLDLTAWILPVLVHVGWEHFYERVEKTGAFEHLELVSFHIGANVLGPFLPSVELYALSGLSVMKGEFFTPAFEFGGALRIYPFKPLALHVSAMTVLFEHGPLLLDGRAQLGVTFDRYEVRIGPRILVQGEAQGFWGPSAAMAVRF